MYIFYFLSLAILSTQAFAETNCKIGEAVRCFSCSHSLMVDCGDGQKGYVSDSEPMTSLTVQVVDDAGTKKLIKLSSPLGGVRQYYDTKMNKWVSGELSKKGVKFKTVDAVSFTTSKAPALYEDADGKTPLAGGADKSFSGSTGTRVTSGLSCEATSEPMLIVGMGSSCGGAKLCHLRVKCSEMVNGKVVRNYGETDAVCKTTRDGGCPPATACVNDPDITMEPVAANVNKSPAIGDLQKTGASQ